jgi:hypothetical protein
VAIEVDGSRWIFNCKVVALYVGGAEVAKAPVHVEVEDHVGMAAKKITVGHFIGLK